MNLKVTHRVKFVIHKVTGELNILYPIKYTNKMQLSIPKKKKKSAHIKISRIPWGLVPILDLLYSVAHWEPRLPASCRDPGSFLLCWGYRMLGKNLNPFQPQFPHP